MNTLFECEETFHPDSHIFICQELIEEASDVAEVIIIKLSLKEDMKRWKVKGQAAAKSEMKQLHFRDTFKPRYHRELN